MSKTERFRLRQKLVHAAGCTSETCTVRFGARGIEYCHRNGVRIPRSLRKYAPKVELDAEWVRMRDEKRMKLKGRDRK